MAPTFWLPRIFSLCWFAAACGDGPSVGEPPPEMVRVLSYNIRHGEGVDGRLDLPRLARVIDEARPDLVALQEVDQGAARTGRADQAAALGELTGLQPIFGPFMPFDGGHYGMAVLSRWPVVSSRNVRLPDTCADCPCNPFPCPEGRTSLVVGARSPASGRTVTFAGVHFYQSEGERLAQARALVADLAGESGPVILAGDFNSLPGTAVMEHFAAEWQVLKKDADALTFPAWKPEVEIDFVLIRKDASVEVTRHVVLDPGEASDHRPIVADLVLR